jgi:hypothetical protein
LKAFTMVGQACTLKQCERVRIDVGQIKSLDTQGG